MAEGIGWNAAEIPDTRVTGSELVLQVRAKGVNFVEHAVPERIVITPRKFKRKYGYDGLIVGAPVGEAGREVVLR